MQYSILFAESKYLALFINAGKIQEPIRIFIETFGYHSNIHHTSEHIQKHSKSIKLA